MGVSNQAAGFGDTDAFLWHDGVMTDLPKILSGKTDSIARAISDRGEIVGDSRLPFWRPSCRPVARS